MSDFPTPSDERRHSTLLDADEKSTSSTSPSQPPRIGGKVAEDYGEKADVNDEDRASLSEDSVHDEANREAELEDGVPAQRVSTRISVNNVSSIPNGGARAWLQVLGSFFLFFNTWYVFKNIFLFHPSMFRDARVVRGCQDRSAGDYCLRSFSLPVSGVLVDLCFDLLQGCTCGE
jgi:hypothetical protein